MNSQEGLRFCTYCGRERTATDRFCARCGQPLGPAAEAQQPPVAAAAQPAPMPRPYPTMPPTPALTPSPTPTPAPRRRLSPGAIVAIVMASVLVLFLLGGGAFAYSQGLFASPKQILLMHMDKANIGKATADGVSARLQFKFTGLSNEPGDWQLIDDRPIDLDVTLLPSSRLMRLSLTTTVEEQPLSAALYADNNRVILETNGMAPTLEALLDEDMSDLPRYLYITDDEIDGELSALWDTIISAQQRQADNQLRPSEVRLLRFMLEAVPDRYFERTKWNEIRISFDHQGLKEIFQAVAGRFYDEPELAADLLADVTSTLPNATASRAELRAKALDQLRAGDRAAVMADIDNSFAEAPVRFELHTITLGFSIGGGSAVAVSGGLSGRDDMAGTSLSYSYSSASAAPGDVQMPTLTTENSLSLEAYLEQKSTPVPMDYIGEDYSSEDWSSWPAYSDIAPSDYYDQSKWREPPSDARDRDSYGSVAPTYTDTWSSDWGWDNYDTPTVPSSPEGAYGPGGSAPSGPVTQPCSNDIYKNRC